MKMHQKSNEDILKDVSVTDYDENGKKVCCLFLLYPIFLLLNVLNNV